MHPVRSIRVSLNNTQLVWQNESFFFSRKHCKISNRIEYGAWQGTVFKRAVLHGPKTALYAITEVVPG